MIHLYQIPIIIFTILSARWQGKRHFSKIVKFNDKQRKAFHFKHGLYFAIVCSPFCYLEPLLIIAALLIRLALFDGFYSAAAGLGFKYIGDGKEWIERQSVKLFGKRGGVKKAVCFGVVLIILNAVYVLEQIRQAK